MVQMPAPPQPLWLSRLPGPRAQSPLATPARRPGTQSVLATPASCLVRQNTTSAPSMTEKMERSPAGQPIAVRPCGPGFVPGSPKHNPGSVEGPTPTQAKRWASGARKPIAASEQGNVCGAAGARRPRWASGVLKPTKADGEPDEDVDDLIDADPKPTEADGEPDIDGDDECLAKLLSEFDDLDLWLSGRHGGHG